MTEECEKCNEGEMGGHTDDVIEFAGMSFCPVTLKQVWTMEEVEEMTEEELAKPGARLELVRPAKYRLVKP